MKSVDKLRESLKGCIKEVGVEPNKFDTYWITASCCDKLIDEIIDEVKAEKRRSAMTDFATGAVRDTGGKGRCDLLPHSSLLRVARHMEDSLRDHEERNWELGIPMHCFLDSAMRHLFKYMDGMTDEDHLAAAATNVLMAMWTEDHMPEMQDVPTRPEHDDYLAFTHDFGGYAPKATEGISEVLDDLPAAKRPQDGPESHGEAPVGS